MLGCLLSKITLSLIFNLQSFAPNLFSVFLMVFHELIFHESYMLPYIFTPQKLLFEVKILRKIVHTTIIINSIS